MPRSRKPARLYYRADERQWVIRDGARQIRTGFSLGERREAEEALAEYITKRDPPERRGPAHPGEITVGEVLARYADFRAEALTKGGADTLARAVASMAPFWGDLTCDAVKGSVCHSYTRLRAIPREVTITTAPARH